MDQKLSLSPKKFHGTAITNAELLADVTFSDEDFSWAEAKEERVRSQMDKVVTQIKSPPLVKQEQSQTLTWKENTQVFSSWPDERGDFRTSPHSQKPLLSSFTFNRSSSFGSIDEEEMKRILEKPSSPTKASPLRNDSVCSNFPSSPVNGFAMNMFTKMSESPQRSQDHALGDLDVTLSRPIRELENPTRSVSPEISDSVESMSALALDSDLDRTDSAQQISSQLSGSMNVLSAQLHQGMDIAKQSQSNGSDTTASSRATPVLNFSPTPLQRDMCAAIRVSPYFSQRENHANFPSSPTPAMTPCMPHNRESGAVSLPGSQTATSHVKAGRADSCPSPIKVHSSQNTSISSSPSWHRTETLYKRRNIPETPENVKEWRMANYKEHLSQSSFDQSPSRKTRELRASIGQVSSQGGSVLVEEGQPASQTSQPKLLVNTTSQPASVSHLPSTRTSGFGTNPNPQPLFKRPITTSSSSSAVAARKSYHNTIELATQRPPTVSDDSASVSVTKENMPANPKTVQPFCLSKEQQHVINLAKQGVSLFYTGSAGTGKSILLKSLIKAMRAIHKDEGAVAVTASTGLAAVNIGGCTLHSFAGVGLGEGPAEKLCKKVRTNKKNSLKWRLCKLLIIDEISMIDGDLLDKLDYIAKGVRKNQEPFGGIQLIFCGDFYQLPPVSKDPDNPTPFAFQSQMWPVCIDHTIVLQEVFRQKGDMDFVEMLNEMRKGQISERTRTRFNSLSRPLRTDDGIEPAELFPTRSEVERANLLRLGKLPGNKVDFHSHDGGSMPQPQRMKALTNFLAPEKLTLKKHAQVMMIKNIDETLVNGSLGKVIEFVDRETYMCYRDVEQNPFDVADEKLLKKKLTIVKREAEKAEQVRREALEALSSSQLLPVSQEVPVYDPLDDSVFDFTKHIAKEGLMSSELEAIERKCALIKDIYTASHRQKLPLVRFSCTDGTTRDVLVEYEEWSVDDDNGKKLVYRRQVPLILAWSLSIHKSQGQTIPKLKVDLRRTFEVGQAYVALSRAVSRTSLQVLNFDPTKVKIHREVSRFYETLVSAEEAIEGVKKLGSEVKEEYSLFDPQDPRDPSYRASAHLSESEKRQNRARMAQEALQKKREAAERMAKKGSYYQSGYY